MCVCSFSETVCVCVFILHASRRLQTGCGSEKMLVFMEGVGTVSSPDLDQQTVLTVETIERHGDTDSV